MPHDIFTEPQISAANQKLNYFKEQINGIMPDKGLILKDFIWRKNLFKQSFQLPFKGSDC